MAVVAKNSKFGNILAVMIMKSTSIAVVKLKFSTAHLHGPACNGAVLTSHEVWLNVVNSPAIVVALQLLTDKVVSAQEKHGQQ